MPKPTYKPKKKSNYSYSQTAQKRDRETDTGDRSRQERMEQRQTESRAKQFSNTGMNRERQTDTGDSAKKARARQNRINKNTSDYVKTAPQRERMTDTGDNARKSRARQNRINKNTSDYVRTAPQRERMTDTATGRSSKRIYGNADATKRAMREKYGTREDNRLSAYDRADYKGKEIERKVQQRYKPSNVSSKRPDDVVIDTSRKRKQNVQTTKNGLTRDDLTRAGNELRKGANAIGGAISKAGREWGNHKYIDKVRTKSGKIRYIYDINTAGGSMTDVNKLNADKAKKRKQVGAKNLKATEAGSRNREAQTKRGNGLLGKARGKAKAFLKWIGR